MPLRTPSYRQHKNGQAFVRIAGKNHYLGVHGTPRSLERYQEVLAEHWQSRRATHPTTWPTLEELMALYLKHCESYYRESNESELVALAMRPLRSLFGELDTCDFRPVKLKRVQAAMVAQGMTRQGVSGSPSCGGCSSGVWPKSWSPLAYGRNCKPCREAHPSALSAGCSSSGENFWTRSSRGRPANCGRTAGSQGRLPTDVSSLQPTPASQKDHSASLSDLRHVRTRQL
jgi:hypothetical protein